MTKRDVLASVQGFDQLNATQLDQIARLCDERHIDAGGVLCHQADFGTETFIISGGEISVVVDAREVARRGPGQIVGDWAMFGDGHRSASLVAVSDTDVVIIDPADVDLLLTAVPQAAAVFGPGAMV